MSTPFRLAASVVALLGLAACSSDDDSTDGTTDGTEQPAPNVTAAPDATELTDSTDSPATPAPPPATVPAELCEQFQVIADLEAESTALMSTGAEFEEIRDLLVSAAAEVDVAYTRIGQLATELEGDATLLREFTNSAAEIAQEVDSIAELQPALLSLPNGLEAGAAALRLNSFSEENCGITTSSGAG